MGHGPSCNYTLIPIQHSTHHPSPSCRYICPISLSLSRTTLPCRHTMGFLYFMVHALFRVAVVIVLRGTSSSLYLTSNPYARSPALSHTTIPMDEQRSR
ncbi:uncharacterized protein SCHCODRAFT_02505715 [Schizophyllum commune H4-8]|uniref:uncharacterized protein n=1 Tax=Schizophyllum commune (strain H4-8 / FGSC 9210) TaxID=578458 RepID=UPI00216081EA|nr:uncharacterized protein SCHCODRAFT_02505715 [Schizophyllum commune H4-8]KAI5891447.1 hypothetical protein SCHCODRAFT_02505715 [Schizophyllum commune H4-8]